MKTETKSINHEIVPHVKAQHARVIETRDRLAAARTEFAAMRQKAADLKLEIVGRKTTLNLLDDKAVEKLHAKERHLELLTGALEMMPLEIEGREERVGQAVRHLGEAVSDAVRPGAALLLDRMASTLLPFCENRPEAEHAAKGLLAWHAYSRLLSPLAGMSSNGSASEVEVDYVLGQAEAIIDGRNPFKFGAVTLE